MKVAECVAGQKYKTHTTQTRDQTFKQMSPFAWLRGRDVQTPESRSWSSNHIARDRLGTEWWGKPLLQSNACQRKSFLISLLLGTLRGKQLADSSVSEEVWSIWMSKSTWSNSQYQYLYRYWNILNWHPSILKIHKNAVTTQKKSFYIQCTGTPE